MTGHTLTATYPLAGWSVPASTVSAGSYLVHFARTEAELDRVLRLRRDVYQLELGITTGSAAAEANELDQRCHHLMVEERETGNVVGAYRMQTVEMAADAGFASAGLFDLSGLPRSLQARAVEVGRACIAKGHRGGRVPGLLWRGVGSYLARNRKSAVLWNCEVPLRDESLAAAIHRGLEGAGAGHPEIRISPYPHTACSGPIQTSSASDPIPSSPPEAFQACLRLGAKLLGPPAVDRSFGTINWLMLLDLGPPDQPPDRSVSRS